MVANVVTRHQLGGYTPNGFDAARQGKRVQEIGFAREIRRKMSEISFIRRFALLIFNVVN
jgi:hypothetical protein